LAGELGEPDALARALAARLRSVGAGELLAEAERSGV
jgi:hypothetical protein